VSEILRRGRREGGREEGGRRGERRGEREEREAYFIPNHHDHGFHSILINF
jgi:hypothetical protein